MHVYRDRTLQQSTLIVFQQQLPVRLVNVSRSGCMLQVSRPVRVGAIARLRVVLEDAEYADDVRIARCQGLPGAGYALGVELLWMPKPNEPRGDAPSLAVHLQGSDEGPIEAGRWPKRT